VVLWDLTRLDLTAEIREQAARDLELGLTQLKAGSRAEALQSYQRALASWQQLVRDDPSNRWYRRNLAGVWEEIGRLHEGAQRRRAALDAYQQALAIRERLTTDHPDDDRLRVELVQYLIDLGGIFLWKVQDRSQAILAFQQAIALQQRSVRDRPTDPYRRRDLALSLSQAMWPLHDAGRFDEAAESVRGALELFDELEREGQLDLGTRAYWVLDQGCFLGQFLARSGRRTEALEALQRQRGRIETILADAALESFRGSSLMDRYSCMLAFCVASVGRAQAELGRLDDARRALEQSRKILRGVIHDKVVFAREESLAVGQTLGLMNEVQPAPSDGERAERRKLADHAVEALRQLIGTGYIHLAYLSGSPSYDALRDRADFQLLVQNLAFPSWPFVGDPPLTSAPQPSASGR
jgi:tetratricopeptide (TPR) repeat protein